jgi:hypothetical protein
MNPFWLFFRVFVAVGVIASGSWALWNLCTFDACSGCPNASAPAAPAPEGRVDDAMFGMEMPAGDEGGSFFVETSRVPLVTGTEFGWRIHLSDDATSVKLREEFVLPATPTTWSHTEDTEIVSGGRVAVTERVLTPEGGWVENGWAFTDGDPEGEYLIRVFLDDELVREFRFRADDPEAKKGCHGG